jgi:MoaA/NifB/PqqE/SkfB family radical SAM enzyme
MRKLDIDIDICGACNLRCPSCPQGNVKDYRLPQGFMSPELLERIVEKAGAECRNVNISLFNWTEPLLHPRLPELIRIIQKAGIPCHLSSNLNILPNVDAIMAENPASLRISVSGFNQETYGRTHRGGNVELVKKHMVELADAKQRNHADTSIWVYYHRYLHNLQEEPLMREFATGLGFKFGSVWALIFPTEKILALEGEDVGDYPLSEEDRALVGSLALPFRAAMEAARKYQNRSCRLRDDELCLNFQGDITLCCGIFDARRYTVGNYLDMPLKEIQAIRQNHPLCGLCMRLGGHVYLTHGIGEMDELALANIAPEDVELLDLRHKITWERRWHRLQEIYRTFFSKALTKEQEALLKNQFDRMIRIAGRARRSFLGKD